MYFENKNAHHIHVGVHQAIKYGSAENLKSDCLKAVKLEEDQDTNLIVCQLVNTASNDRFYKAELE